MSNSKVYETTTVDVPNTTLLKDFFALIKVGIVNSNLITTLTGFYLAVYMSNGSFLDNIVPFILTMVGSVFIIAGSCAYNNYYDRDIDPFMERTKTRPTVTGRIEPRTVLIFSLVLILVGLLLLSLTTTLALIIGFIGVFSYIVLYTIWSKRRYVSNTIIGSISGATPPLIGWAAVTGDLSTTAWMLFLIMFIWQPPHFYALAMRRVEEYRAAGIPMLPVVKGFKRTKISMIVWIIALLPLPFFMTELSIGFVIIATLLNIGWLVMGVYARKYKDDIKWAISMFVYSIQYLTVLFVSMIIFTLF